MMIIKIGGNMVGQLDDAFFDQVKALVNDGEHVVIVHGGGNLITQSSQFIGLKTTKLNGIRVTNAEMMGLTKSVLCDVVQMGLAKQFLEHGIPCNSLNQDHHSLLNGEYLNQSLYGEVGVVNHVGLDELMNQTNGAVGLCAPLVVGPTGSLLNVNADFAAEALAVLTNADQLILMTDVAGVLLNDDVLTQLSHDQAIQMVASEQLVAGMIPKVKAAFEAIQNGVKNVSITNQLNQAGTMIVA